MDVEVDVELLPDTTGRRRFDRAMYVLVGLAAISASLIGLLEAHSGAREERSYAVASRLSVEIFGKIAGSGTRRSFETTALQDANALGVEALGRGIASFEEETLTDAFLALSEADQRAAERLPDIITAMTDPARSDTTLDPATAEIAGATLSDIQNVLEEQQSEVDTAEKYGGRQDRSVFALSLVALAAIFLGLAGALGANQVGRMIMATGALVLLASIALAASALFV